MTITLHKRQVHISAVSCSDWLAVHKFRSFTCKGRSRNLEGIFLLLVVVV